MKPSSNVEGFFCSFVYAFNNAAIREMLWVELMEIADKINHPWILGGDFNYVLNKEEGVGSPVRDIEMYHFRRCVEHCTLADIKFVGCNNT